MPETTVKTKFFQFNQNNSGGSFDINDERGIGTRMWVEALNDEDANNRAERIGIYFNGCDSGMDCECCGDRWSPAWREGVETPEINQEYDFNWDSTVYVHRLDRTIERIKKAAA